ncbi:MAG: hypothetical protein IJI25_08785 [Eubacterium sp.]|nr:hypothetical protein [Eubacterium sp.]
MGGRGSSSGLTSSHVRTATPIPPQPPQQPPQPAAPQTDSQGFSDTDSSPFHDLKGGRNYYNQQQFDIDARNVLPDYIDPNTTSGSLYNASQNMNYALLHGTMDAQQQYMYDSLVSNMHNLGQNLNLTRYDHLGALDAMLTQVTGGAITSGSGLSISALHKALVGGTYTDQRILSTSFNNFQNSQDPLTFTTRQVKITYKAKASAQALMPGISNIPMKGSGMKKGDDLGEMLLAPTGNGHNTYRITDVKYSGAGARPKGGSKYYTPLKQIEIVVEVD